MAHSEIITAIMATLLCQLTAQAIRKMPLCTFCGHMQAVAQSLRYELTEADKREIVLQISHRIS